MATHIIKIYGGYPDTQKLELSDNGRSEVEQGSEIEWIIDNQTGSYPGSIEVDSIDALESKLGPNDKIFKLPPKKEDGKFKGKIKRGLGSGKKWRYDIYWTARNEKFKYDPIISVKPVNISNRSLLVGIAVALGALIAFQFLRKKKRDKGASDFFDIP